MPEKAELNRVVLDALVSRITKILPDQIRSCVEKLSEDELWWRPNDQSNSVGNLVLHLSGSMRHYIAHSIGGQDYERDRPAEFSERGPVPKQELLSTFDETMRQVKETLVAFDTARFLEPAAEPSYNPTLFNQIFNVAVHAAVHTGQIVFITKMLEAGSLDELWIRTHQNLNRAQGTDDRK
jgi:uncharacterized damage-inducible protein DinB